MSDTQIRVRFSAAGLKQIRDDLKATGQEGSTAFVKVADAADKPNKALGLTLRELEQVRESLRQAGREGDAAFKRIDGAVRAVNPLGNPLQARAPIGPQTSLQSRINASTGVSGQTYSAAASASAFMEMEKRATALRDVLNPTAEAERKLSTAVGEASQLLAAGAITEAEHTAAVAVARKEFAAAEHAARGLAGGVGLNRMQMMELGHSARAMADGLASGANPARLLAMESGRLVQTFGEGNGGLSGLLGKLPGLLRGPIGLFGGIATAVLTAAAAEHGYAEAQETLERSLLGAGRATGATTADLERVAEASGQAGNVSVSAARKMEVAFLSTGKIGTAQIGGLISISRDFAAAMGMNAKQATQELAQAFADPARGADQLNDKLHFLSDATRQEIHDLQESGDRAQAQTILMRELGDATGGAADHLSSLGKALHIVADAFSDAWNWSGKFIYNLTHVPDATALANVDKQLANLDHVLPNDVGGQNQLAALRAERAKLVASMQKTADAPTNDINGRAADTIRSLNPDIKAVHDLRDELSLLQKANANGWKGMDADVISRGRRDIIALTQAIKTYIPERERQQQLAEIDAKIAARPGAAVRSQLMAERARVQVAGEVLTPDEVGARVASGAERGYNRGERVDQSAARKAAAEAERAAAAEREWTAAKAEALKVDHNLTDAENKLADLRNRGARINPAEAQAYLSSARAKDAGEALKRQEAAAKSDRDWAQAISGVTHESENLDRALDLIAKRTEENKAPTQGEIDRLIALATAADRAAEATKALEAAKSAVKEASADVFGSLQEPKTSAGRYDPTAATRQWQNARVAIYAEAEQRIREEQQARVAAGEQSEQQAAENTARAIAGIDAAYALQSAQETLTIRKKAADDGIRYNEEQEAAFNSRIASTAGDFGSAIMKLAGGASVGNVGRDLAKQILEQILQTLVSDPLVALIKQQLQQVVSPQAAGGGGPLGLLSMGLRTLFGAPADGLSKPGLSTDFGSMSASLPSMATDLSSVIPDITITPPGFASGTNGTPDGLRWVGEHGPELEWGGGKQIMSAANSAGWIKGLQERAFSGGAAAGGSGDTHLHYAPVTHIDATGADPAQLQRTQDSMSRWQRGEPARVGAYLKAAKLK